jgi:hypothetical protein
MKTVYKYVIPPAAMDTGLFMEFPENAELLSVGEQNPDVVLWALVDSEEPVRKRFIRVVGTGHPIKHEPWPKTYRSYIGTVQMADGIVLHVFEEWKD